MHSPTSIDVSKSIEQFEDDVWPHNDFQSHVVRESQRLRKVALRDLTPEDLRLLIGQKIGLQCVLPIAIGLVQENPLLEASLFPGDLLKNILNVPSSFWEKNSELNNALVEIGPSLKTVSELLTEELLPAFEKLRYR